MSGWQISQLIELIRHRYPDWAGFEHAQYTADEIIPKRKLVEKASQHLTLDLLDQQIGDGDFEAIFAAIKQLTQHSNLLWRRVPASGDTAVLEDPTLDKAQFATQIRNLLYGDRPSPERLQTFSDYLTTKNLPNKWPFATFLLFITHPETELFVKSRSAKWFLKFMGENTPFPLKPGHEAYAQLQKLAHLLLDAIRPLGAIDMLDVQSIIWIGMRESKNQVGSLDHKSQIYLDVPPTPPMNQLAGQTVALREAASQPYQTTPRYGLAEMAKETGLDEAEIERWLQVIKRKKQIVFYGPPGTGKTYIAQKLGKLLATQGEGGFSETIQFHPAYSYEEFLEGLRPLTSQENQLIFSQKAGLFLTFCQKAAQHPTSPCTLIIDEINRANLATVFGKLMLLLEYRNKTIPLASGTPFSIPHNVRLIATMNSADRSLALVDFALRRRFAFIQLQPRYDLILKQQTTLNLQKLVQLLHTINQKIDDPNYALGHTYFLHPNLDDHIQDIWELEIMPYLQEYFFGSTEPLKPFEWASVQKAIFHPPDT